jgi:ABC-type multidrug transport system fused ATPase/permease subunit
MKDTASEFGVYQFLRSLPFRYHLGFLMTGLGAIVTTVLDAVGLALVAPVIALIAGSTEDLTTSQVVDWTRTALDWVNLEFRLRWLVLLVLGLTMVRSVLLLAQSWISALFAVRYEAELRVNGYSAIMNSSWPYYLRQRSGNLMNMLIEESSRSGGAYGVLNNGIISLLNLFTYLAFALLISWELTLATAAATAGLIVVYGVLSRIARILGQRLSEISSDMVSEINEGLSGAKIFKSEALERMTISRFRDVVYRRADVQKLTVLNTGLFAASSELIFVGLLLGGLVLGTRVFDLPSTTVFVFSLLFFRIYQRARAFQSTILAASGSLPAVAVVRSVTTEGQNSVEPQDGLVFEGLKSGIEFRDVVFNYGTGEPVLNGLSMMIPTGTTVALVGPSGMGKTTIIDLTIGLLRPTSGQVLVNDVPLETYSIGSWRTNLAYVSQETILFHDSVFRNIAWGRENVTDEDVYEAAQLADADGFIRRLADGYDTVIGDRGMRLSGGQRQRIALARAILRKPGLLILDEATSELDSRTEARIQSTFEKLQGQATIMMAAHRLSTIRNADQICVIGEGTIVESGTMEDLLAKRGAFYRLYQGLEDSDTEFD